MQIQGRARFDPLEVAWDEADGGLPIGPFPAWMLFIWKVNELAIKEVFSTGKATPLQIVRDEPAPGWTTEQYNVARVLFPPRDSHEYIMIVADDTKLWPIWDMAMAQVVKGGAHIHAEHG